MATLKGRPTYVPALKETRAPFRVLDRLVDPSLNRITTASGETVQVEPKIMQVLVVLAERPRAVVTRAELMDRVWSGVFVTDDALHRAIRELRRLFGDDPESPRAIETIRKRGYRLIAPVEDPNQQGAPGGLGSPSNVVTPPAESGARKRTDAVAAAAVIGIAATAVVAWLGAGRREGDSAARRVDLAARVRFVPLTSDPGNEVDPALSASGRLAYVARGEDGRAHIFTKASADAPAAQVTRGDTTEHAPTWSPDESKLAFVRSGGGSCAIWIAAADGREARALTPCTTDDEFRMSWSPDNRLLAVTAGRLSPRTPSHIEVIDAGDGSRRTVTAPPPAHSGDWSPAFSPDGSRLAFIRNIGGSIADLFVVPVGGGEPARVTTDNADILGVDWTPDGGSLVFSSDRAGGIGLWRVPVEGGPPAMLAGGGAKLKHPSVARRGNLVAYEDWQYEINLREQSTEDDDATAAAVSPTSDRWNVHPQISPDGRRLVFQSTRSGQYELWVSDRDGSNARPLTRTATYKSPARWSSDSRHVVFTMRTGTGSEIDVLDVDNGSVRTIAHDDSTAVAPAWSADGASIYFGSLRSGDWQIWRVDVAGGALRQVTNDGVYAAMESRDGRWLYVARLDRRGLWRRPVNGAAEGETLVAERVAAEQWPNWGLYDRGIYYVTWPDDGDPCVVVAEAGAPPRVLARMPEFAWSGIALSRDGSRVIYAHTDRRASNIGAIEIQ